MNVVAVPGCFNSSVTKKNFTILRAVRSLEMNCDIDERQDVTNIERDSPDYVTVYGTEIDGQLWYLVLSQKLIEELKKI